MTPKQKKIIKIIYIALAMFYMVILEIIRNLSMAEIYGNTTKRVS